MPLEFEADSVELLDYQIMSMACQMEVVVEKARDLGNQKI